MWNYPDLVRGGTIHGGIIWEKISWEELFGWKSPGWNSGVEISGVEISGNPVFFSIFYGMFNTLQFFALIPFYFAFVSSAINHFVLFRNAHTQKTPINFPLLFAKLFSKFE